MKTFFPEKSIKLSKYLLEAYEGTLSYSMLNKLFRKKDIKVDGVRISKDTELKGCEKVEVYFDGAEKKLEYNVLFEDDNVLVVYKPKNITSEDFYKYLKHIYNSLEFCHRLDRNTDGIMLFAKNEQSYNEILSAFKNRTFEKIYVATVYGKFDKKSATLTHYLMKDSEKSQVAIFDKEGKNTKIIKSSYIVIGENENTSTIAVKLLTGRTHQIRAQFAHVGHFVLGDGKYGNQNINKQLNAREMMLTSAKLTLNFKKGDSLAYLNGCCFILDNYKNLQNLTFFD